MTFLNFKGGHIPLTQIFTPVGRKNFSYAGALSEIYFFANLFFRPIFLQYEKDLRSKKVMAWQVAKWQD